LKQRVDTIGPVTPIKYTDPNVSEDIRIDFSSIVYIIIILLIIIISIFYNLIIIKIKKIDYDLNILL
jgi:hypothetical protein